ncbi:MAG: hypothetical protein ACFFE4_09985 [Candidatus Thorarchaeota archaeon]
MVSKLQVTGLIFLILGVLLMTLANVVLPALGISVIPFYATTGEFTQGEIINPGSTREDISIFTNIPGFISNLNIKAKITLDSSNDMMCRVTLIYEDINGSSRAEMDWTSENIFVQGGGSHLESLSTPISFAAAGSGFSLFLKIENQGSNAITLVNSRVDIIYNVPSFYLPVIFILIGILLTIVPFIRSRRTPSVRKAPKVGTGWEPTLQWGGGSGKASEPEPTKKSRFTIKSSKKQKPTATKVVRKAAPVSGTQVSCKFCGKNVSPSAFFCPHCYGKLR